ncbi:MAG: hypothetical protein AAF533_15135 [Acidobacteriota bacterium]
MSPCSSRLVRSISLVLLVTVSVGCERAVADRGVVSSERTLVGQLLLPSGSGSRGVEVIVTVASAEDESRKTWLLLDDLGRFSHSFRGEVTELEVTAALGAGVHRLDAESLPATDTAGRIDLGLIDLRDRLATHRVRVRAAEGARQGVVRVALWSGPPPTGPQGESVSLGSRQFPPLTLGDEREWLVSPEARSLYFLVERPDGPGRGRSWRSGRQQLFGPFATAELPAVLHVD